MLVVLLVLNECVKSNRKIYTQIKKSAAAVAARFERQKSSKINSRDRDRRTQADKIIKETSKRTNKK